MASLYNNLTDFGRTKLRFESVLLYALAVLALVGAVYYSMSPRDGGRRRRRGLRLLSAAALMALLAWLSASVSARDNSFSRLLAASSGLQFFAMPWLS